MFKWSKGTKVYSCAFVSWYIRGLQYLVLRVDELLERLV